MAQARSEILDWGERGLIAPGNVRRALEVGKALPTLADWRRFLDRLLLFLAAVLLAAAVTFFFAYNWNDLGRLAKLALAQVPLIIALALVWRLGLERISGKAALLAAALLAGVLLALIGQIYQTGADTFELFAAWALAIAPWVLVSRFAALWLLWLALANLSITVYFQTFHGLLGLAIGPERQLWLALALNAGALALWQWAARAGVAWLQERWALRLIATACAVIATVLGMMAIGDWHVSRWGIVGWLAWMGGSYAVYRHTVKDVYVLALDALSLIAVMATLLARLTSRSDAGAYLFIGLVVIGLSAAAGYWLRRVAAEGES
jgi:uncharacterized membrane protein